MRPIRIILLALGVAAATRAAPPLPAEGGPYRNLFRELLGKSDAESDAKISAAWRQLFYGDERTERLYYPVEGDMAYVPDVANNDVRTEGLSYAMMICVQLDKKREFDGIWKWARTHLYHAEGPFRGYFAWHGDFNGCQIDAGPAPDGEEWFTTALFFASHRWGDGEGIFNYGSEAQAILRTMLHKDGDPGRGRAASMFDGMARQVVFSPKVTAPISRIPRTIYPSSTSCGPYGQRRLQTATSAPPPQGPAGPFSGTRPIRAPDSCPTTATLTAGPAPATATRTSATTRGGRSVIRPWTIPGSTPTRGRSSAATGCCAFSRLRVRRALTASSSTARRSRTTPIHPG